MELCITYLITDFASMFTFTFSLSLHMKFIALKISIELNGELAS